MVLIRKACENRSIRSWPAIGLCVWLQWSAVLGFGKYTSARNTIKAKRTKGVNKSAAQILPHNVILEHSLRTECTTKRSQAGRKENPYHRQTRLSMVWLDEDCPILKHLQVQSHKMKLITNNQNWITLKCINKELPKWDCILTRILWVNLAWGSQQMMSCINQMAR